MQHLLPSIQVDITSDSDIDFDVDDMDGALQPSHVAGDHWCLGGILALWLHCALLLDKVLPKEPPGTPSKCP